MARRNGYHDPSKDYEEQLKQLDKKNARIMVDRFDKTERSFSTMLDRQQQMLTNFYKASSESGRESIRNDMEERQKQMKSQLDDMRRSYALYSQFMTKSEKKTFEVLYRTSRDGMESIEKEMSRRFDGIGDEFDDVTETILDKVKDLGDQLRDISITLNLNELVQGMQEQIDSYTTNQRQVSSHVGDDFDFDGLSEVSDLLAKRIGSFDRSRSSEFVTDLIKETGMKSIQEMTPYLENISSAEILGVSRDDMVSLMWRDMAYGKTGRWMTSLTNMAISLSENEDFYVSIDGILGKISENIGDISALSGKDFKKTNKMVASLAALETMAASSDSSGTAALAEDLMEWTTLTMPELMEESSAVAFANMLGMGVGDLYDILQNPEYMDDMVGLFQSRIDSMTDYQLKYWADEMGYERVAQLRSLASDTDAVGVLQSAFTEANEVLNQDSSINSAVNSANELTGWMEEMKTEVSTWGVPKFFESVMTHLDLQGSDISNMAAWGSLLIDAFQLFSGKGAGKGLLGKLFKSGGSLTGTVGKLFKSGGSGTKASKWLSSAKGWVSGLFKGGTKYAADDVAKMLGTSIDDVYNILGNAATYSADDIAKAFGTSIDDVVKTFGDDALKAVANYGDDAAKLAGTAGSTLFSTLASVFGFAVDGFMGGLEANDWFGEGAGFGETAASVFGSMLGGSGAGWFDDASLLDKGLNTLGNTAKWTAVGALAGPIGAGVGAIAGLITSAIGGENIANFFVDAGEAIADGAVWVWDNGLKPAGKWIGKKLSQAGDWIGDKAASVRDSFVTAYNWITAESGGLRDALRDGASWIGEKATDFGNVLIDAGQELWESFTGWLEDAGDWLGDAIDGVGDAIDSAGDFMYDNNVLGYKWLSDGISYVGGLFNGSHADGLGYVPFDGYRAELHKGEAVLTASQAESLRAYKDNSDVIYGILDILTLFYESWEQRVLEERYSSDNIFDMLKRSVLGDRSNTEKDSYTYALLNGSGRSSFNIPFFADGGIVTDTTLGVIGEKGPEAVIPLTGNKVSEQIWDYLIRSGLSEFGAAGAMGNLYAESRLDPRNLENQFENTSRVSYLNDSNYTESVDRGMYKNFVKDGAGYGLAQWTYKGFKDDMLALSKTAGVSIGDLGFQMNFLVNSLKSDFRSLWSYLKGSTSVLEASNRFLFDYENPANKDRSVQELRASYGKKFYDMYAYEQGTPWMPNDQIALVHEGEMIVPESVNPLNRPSVSVPLGSDTDNSEIIDTLKWMVHRLEAKLDRLIAASSSNVRRKVDMSEDMNRLYSF